MDIEDNRDSLPVMVVTDANGFLVWVGQPRKLTAKEQREYMQPGWQIRNMSFKEYTALKLTFKPIT